LIPGNRAFLLKPKQRSKASVLLLHGFSASPFEVRDCGRHLQKKGYLVCAPLLAGHGSSRAEFDAKGCADWIQSAEVAYAKLRQSGKKMILIGHSAGGVLAALLAAKHPKEIKSLILAAPAFQLASLSARLSRFPFFRLFRPSIQIEPRSPESKHWTLSYSSHRVAELVRLGRLGLKAVPQLELPVLLLQSRGDPLVSRPFNESLFKKIPGTNKQLRIYETAEHNVLHHSNPLQGQVFGWMDKFLEQ
jgi:carboxylesterase